MKKGNNVSRRGHGGRGGRGRRGGRGGRSGRQSADPNFVYRGKKTEPTIAENYVRQMGEFCRFNNNFLKVSMVSRISPT